MKGKDWQKAAQMVWQRQAHIAVSSLSFSQLSMDESGPPVVIQGMDAPLSTSTPAQAHLSNHQSTEAVQEDTPYRQVLPNVPPQSFYPSLATMGTATNTTVSPEIPFSQQVIKDTENHQRMLFSETVEEEQIPFQHHL